MIKRLSYLLALGLCAAAMLGQDESRPYLALSSEKTFGTGEQPTIDILATQVTDLDFRVYKVRDAVKFFQRLEDPHMFGSNAPKPPREKTPLEQFHETKVRWHGFVRNLFRAQFSQDARLSFHDWREGKEIGSSKAALQKNLTEYAAAPLLNPDQLVTTWKQKTEAKSRWDHQTIPVKVKEPGVYLVEAVNKDLRAYTILMVTDVAMITKSMPGRLVAFVANRKTGEPVRDCEVISWADPSATEKYRTNEQGLVEVSAKDASKRDALVVIARNGDHVAVSSLYTEIFNEAPSRHATAYLYTDRPVYRPGHTVHFKGILRNASAAGYVVPNSGSVDTEIQDPDGKTVYRKSLSLSSNAAINGDYVAPADAPLGYYSLIVHLAETEERSTGFYIEEYKKPEYEVRVTPEKQRLLQGESIRATIDARYYYGEPVARAKVKYVVHTSRYWYPRYYDDDDRNDYDDAPEYDYGGEQADEQTGTLDADGKLVVEIPTAVSKDKVDVRYRVEARVTDEGGREIAGGNAVIATYGTFLANIRPEQYVGTPGQPTWFKIETRDYNDQPLAAGVHVEFYQWRPKRNGQAALPDKLVTSVDAQTDEHGNARVSFTPPEAGSYEALVVAKGSGPRDVEDKGYLWVSGSGSWYTGDEETVQIVPDKKEYKPGDVAKVLIVTGVPKASVLVTTESRGIGSVRVYPANSQTLTIDVPIKAESEPNFYLSASFFHGGQFHFGQKRIRVPAIEKQLAVEVTSPKMTYKPGEPAQLTVIAKDSAGRPVEGDFSIGVVDEAIYAIHPDTAANMMQFFYGHSENYVATDNSLHYSFMGEAGKRRMRLAALRAGKLAQLKPDRLVQPKIRKAFPDTILWIANVNTGSDGKATVNVSYPDSLTAWRTTTRGITSDTKVGSATLRTVVRKDLLVSLAVPRFFTKGDEVTIAANVRNYLPRDKMARVSLDVKGMEIVKGTAHDVLVPSKGEVKVEWRVRPNAIGQATLLAKALTDEESDGVELTLPINPQGVKMVDAKAGSLAGDKDIVEFDVPVPSQLVAGSRKVEIRVMPSVSGAVFAALDYLTSFPYGCTEQTMSSFLPNVIVSHALKEVGVEGNVDKTRLDKKINAGLERLYDFQHEDGGWGWWKSDESQIFLTSYVVNGLAQARATQVYIKPDAIDRGSEWLRGALKKEPNLLLDLRAYAVYSLVLAAADDKDHDKSADKELLDYIDAHRDRLSPYGLALYGLALEAAGDARAADVANQLEKAVKITGDEASWSMTRDTLMDLYTDATAETTAYAVKLLVHKKPGSPVLEKAALWLMNHRNEGEWWYSTKQTAMVIYGLTDYLKMTGELKPNFTASVSVNGQDKLSKSFSAADALSPNAAVIPVENPTGSIHVRVQRKGTGRLYWNMREDYYATGEQIVSTGNNPLNLTREYFKLVPERVGEKIVHNLEPVTGPVKQGDTLAVRLTMTGNDWRYVLIEDPIPSGTEFVERSDLYELNQKPSWWGFWADRMEFHDDHLAIFQSWCKQGRSDYTYLLKVVNPGHFQISPARVQPMYQPQYFATTNSSVLEVQ